MINELIVKDKDTLLVDGKEIRCAIGIQGFAKNKREGDGKTPIGKFPLRECYYRADRIEEEISSELTLKKLTPVMGWCDAPASEYYNKRVRVPFKSSHEELWRKDSTYDIIIPMGYNDDPVEPHKGSAIFFHLTDKDYKPTQGCVAVSRADMLSLLPNLGPNTLIHIAPESVK